MLHSLQNPSQAGEDEGKLFLLFSHPPFICAMLNAATSLSSSLPKDWSGMGEQWEWQHWFLNNAVLYNFCGDT